MTLPHWCSGRSAPSGCASCWPPPTAGSASCCWRSSPSRHGWTPSRRHRVKWSGVQPTVIRMLLEADVPPSDLASLAYLPGGSGPLEPELQREFETRYGIPLLWGYGATEFAGTVCTWTPQLRAEYGDSKPGTVGRPLPGVAVRIVDPDSGAAVVRRRAGSAVGAGGRARPALDHHHRHRVDRRRRVRDGARPRRRCHQPGRVQGAAGTHPHGAARAPGGAGRVRGGSVPDARLGEAPFAAVEIRPGALTPTEDELKAIVREQLPAPCVPVAIRCVDQLPRNAVMKVRVDAVRAMYERA